MQKACRKCGESMFVRLRTVIFSSKVEIENVPIYSCDACHFSEIYPQVKNDLKALISELGSRPDKQQFHFEDLNEVAHLIWKATDKSSSKVPVESLIEERINQLLDLLLVAQSLQDEQWIGDIRKRLSQITTHSMTA